MKKKFTVFSDPGHAWAKVHLIDLLKLNLLDKITPYSYTKGDYVYLEEDLDLSTFHDALREIDVEPVWVVKHTNKSSKIRSYERYYCPDILSIPTV